MKPYEEKGGMKTETCRTDRPQAAAVWAHREEASSAPTPLGSPSIRQRRSAWCLRWESPPTSAPTRAHLSALLRCSECTLPGRKQLFFLFWCWRSGVFLPGFMKWQSLDFMTVCFNIHVSGCLCSSVWPRPLSPVPIMPGVSLHSSLTVTLSFHFSFSGALCFFSFPFVVFFC